MKRSNVKDFAKVILGAIPVLGLMCWAGQQDYQDAVVSEMKNNGMYYTMSEQHPEWDEAEMVKEYTEWKEKNEECRWSNDR